MAVPKGGGRLFRDFRRWAERRVRLARKRRFYPVYLSLIILLIWGLLAPDSLSSFVWRYFWGPVVADVGGHPVDGIKEGYNPVNTTVYALLLVAAIYYGYPYIRRSRIFFGPYLLISLLPLIFAGALARVMEDAGAYPENLAWLFVSPFIYLLFGAVGVFHIFFAAFLEKREKYEAVVLSVIPYPLGMKALWYAMGDGIGGADILFLMFLSIVFAGYHAYMVRKKGYEMASSVFLYSSFYLSAFVYFSSGLLHHMVNPGIVPYSLILALIPVFIIYLISKMPKGSVSAASIPMNLVLIFSQSLDGAATCVASEIYGYGEKHVLSSAILAYGGLAFFISKVLLSVAAVYVVDVLEKEGIKSRAFWNLVRFTIIFIGLGPAIRDIIRVAYGI